jgi:hypothetical protein
LLVDGLSQEAVALRTAPTVLGLAAGPAALEAAMVSRALGWEDAARLVSSRIEGFSDSI